jgi:hypothetical protein
MACLTSPDSAGQNPDTGTYPDGYGHLPIGMSICPKLVASRLSATLKRCPKLVRHGVNTLVALCNDAVTKPIGNAAGNSGA